MQFRNRVPIFGWAVVVAFACAVAVSTQAVSPFSGTWRLNVAKSKWSPGPPSKSGTNRYEVTQDGFKGVLDGVNGQGQTTHTEYTCRFDGKDCPITGTVDGKAIPAPTGADVVAWKKIDDYTYEYVVKLKGQILSTTRIVIAKDGKTQTRTTTGKNAQGQTVNNTAVYEKQ